MQSLRLTLHTFQCDLICTELFHTVQNTARSLSLRRSQPFFRDICSSSAQSSARRDDICGPSFFPNEPRYQPHLILREATIKLRAPHRWMTDLHVNSADRLCCDGGRGGGSTSRHRSKRHPVIIIMFCCQEVTVGRAVQPRRYVLFGVVGGS